jgi:hypothetical protein
MFVGLDIPELVLPDPLEAQPEPTDVDENPHLQNTKRIQPPEWMAKKPKVPYSLVQMPCVVATWKLLTANLADHQVDLVEKAPEGSAKAIVVYRAGRKFFVQNPLIAPRIQKFLADLEAGCEAGINKDKANIRIICPEPRKSSKRNRDYKPPYPIRKK